MRQVLCLLLGVVTVESFATSLPDDIERITTTTSRFETIQSQHAGSIAIVDENALDMTSVQHIQQVINRVAGVNLQRGNGQEYLPALRSPVFTGAGACGELLTAEDGIALRASGFCNINELFEAGTEYAQRIEVLKGPGTAIYGSNALHGVINVITQNPIQADEKIEVELGSFGYKRLGLNAGNNQAQNGLGINLSVTDDTGYRDEEGVEQTKLHVRYATLINDINVSAGLSISDLDQETAGFITGLNSYRDAEIAQSNANPEAFRQAQSARLWLKLEGQADWRGKAVNWQITPYIRDQEMDFLMHFLPGQPLEQNAQDSFGVLSSAKIDLTPSVVLTIGADAELTSGSLRQFQASPTQGSAFLQATIPSGLQYDYEVDASTFAVFTDFSWLLSDDFTLNFGLRAEQVEYDYDNLMVSGRVDESGQTCGFGGCRYSRPDDRTDDFSQVSPQISARYALSDNSMLYATVANGYRAPQATELYRLQRAQESADLDSVEAVNTELGYRWFGESASLQLSIYSMDKDNVIFRDADFFNRSDARTRHQGLEATIKLQLAPQWQLNSAVTYARHEYRNNLGDLVIAGNDMDTAPRWLGNVQLAWQPSDNISAELDWRYTSDYYLEPENTVSYSGHNIADVRVLWVLSESLSLNVQVLNALDRAYAERADFTTFSGPRYFPGKPRHAQVGVSYQF